MKDIKIAFQGELGAYSHIACEKLFPGSQIKACPTFEETFRFAHQDENSKIIIPIENSLAGRVADIHYLLPKYKLQIYAEHFQKVTHNLLAIKGAKIKDIKTVRSHAQAIGQCQKIIIENKLTSIISADTAGSAKLISTKNDKTESAIASDLAAKIYDLEILKSNIEDEVGNVTRFLIMGKDSKHPELKGKKYIKKGDIFQVVLSQRFETKLTKKPIEIYKKLRVTNPSPFMFFFNFNDFQIIGASPEILVRLRNNVITVRPIAGTRPRGRNNKEDNLLKKDLINDKKELSEHLMLLDLGRNDAGKVSKINTVKVTEKFKIEKYSHVMHIVSNVTGVYDKKFSKFEALMAGFPAGTVSGAPKIRAMEIIDELEKNSRKIYAGGIGYFSANGDFDTCIALRTAVTKNNKFYVQAGAGIVADSKPINEYNETINKAKALIKSLEK